MWLHALKMEVITMNEFVVRFPVTCPVCNQESIARLSLDAIAHLLATGRPVQLHAKCARHSVAWFANEIERNQIQVHADAVRLTFSRKSNRIRHAHQRGV